MPDIDPADRSPAGASPAGAAAPWREPVRGGHPDPGVAARPGRALIDGMLAGDIPAPPLSHLTGMRLLDVDAGQIRFEMPLSPWLAGADGAVGPGALTIPADAAMACAIIATLPAGTGLTTSELSIRQVRRVEPGGAVVATARMLHAGPPMALAEATVADGQGRLIARVGSLCVALPLSAPPDPVDPPDPATPGAAAAAPTSGTPDPWQRPLSPGSSVPPLHQLVGLRPLPAGPGEAAFALPASGWLCAPPPGRVQGGAVATLVDATIAEAIRSAAAAPGGARWMPVELQLNYLRPLASDGREAVARARLVHAGRRTAVARAEVSDADGRVIAVASGTAVDAGGAGAGP